MLDTRFSDLDFQPLLYVPVLSNSLQSLHAHLSLVAEFKGGQGGRFVRSSIPRGQQCCEVFFRGLSSHSILRSAAKMEAQSICHQRIPVIICSFLSSVSSFILIERPLIVMSLFALHNETRSSSFLYMFVLILVSRSQYLYLSLCGPHPLYLSSILPRS